MKQTTFRIRRRIILAFLFSPSRGAVWSWLRPRLAARA